MMTYQDVYNKFMIEYDKVNVTSSYPSFTKEEIAVFLDKAYLALIAQKITGNNIRRSQLESDIKSIADINPLIKTEENIEFEHGYRNRWDAKYSNDKFLYFVKATLTKALTNHGDVDFNEPIALITNQQA